MDRGRWPGCGLTVGPEALGSKVMGMDMHPDQLADPNDSQDAAKAVTRGRWIRHKDQRAMAYDPEPAR